MFYIEARWLLFQGCNRLLSVRQSSIQIVCLFVYKISFVEYKNSNFTLNSDKSLTSFQP